MVFGFLGLAGKTGNGAEKDVKFEKDLITGLISLILLSITANSKEPLYGYQIAKRMEDTSAGIELKQGTIYPVLRTMEKKGLLKSTIKASESGPPRKYYSITKKGLEKLDVWRHTWDTTRSFVDGVLFPSGVPRPPTPPRPPLPNGGCC